MLDSRPLEEPAEIRLAHGRRRSASLRWLLLGIALFGLGSVAVALWTQHALGMEPCPWCFLQRLIVVLIALLAPCLAAGQRVHPR